MSEEMSRCAADVGGLQRARHRSRPRRVLHRGLRQGGFPELPDHAVYEGREGVREIERQFGEMWGELVQEPIEFIEAGDALVVAVIAMRGQGKGSGAPLDAQAVWIHELCAGKLARRAFTTKARAFEASGLLE